MQDVQVRQEQGVHGTKGAAVKLVPDTDYVQQAKAKFEQIAVYDDWRGHSTYHVDLLNILVHATLAGADREDLYEIATVCASVVFLPEVKA